MSAQDNEERRRLLNDSPTSRPELKDSEYDSEEPVDDSDPDSNSRDEDESR